MGSVRGYLTEARAHGLVCGGGSVDRTRHLRASVCLRLPASLRDATGCQCLALPLVGTDTGAHSPAGSFLALWLDGAVRQNHLLKLPEAGPYRSGSAAGVGAQKSAFQQGPVCLARVLENYA